MYCTVHSDLRGDRGWETFVDLSFAGSPQPRFCRWGTHVLIRGLVLTRFLQFGPMGRWQCPRCTRDGKDRLRQLCHRSGQRCVGVYVSLGWFMLTGSV